MLTDVQRYKWAKDIWDNLSFHQRIEAMEKAGYEMTNEDKKLYESENIFDDSESELIIKNQLNG